MDKYYIPQNLDAPFKIVIWTADEFLSFVNPKHAIISVGYNNKFNHPSEEVLNRLENLKIVTHRTDKEGAVVFETKGIEWKFVNWR